MGKHGTHNIEATETQIGYLNDLAIAHSRYREAAEALSEAAKREAGTAFWGIGAQTLNEVVKHEGALRALLNLKWIMYSGVEQADYEKVEGWIKLALEVNPGGIFSANQFYPVRK